MDLIAYIQGRIPPSDEVGQSSSEGAPKCNSKLNGCVPWNSGLEHD